METTERILEGARQLFFSYGIRSVSMDDIAGNLGMSKKTLYQHFRDKDDILKTLLVESLESNNVVLKKLETDAKDAVEEIMFIMNHISEMFSRINPLLFYDMQKYYPEVWKIFQAFKQNSMIKMVERNLEKGIAQGHFREDINVRIIAKMRIEQVETAMNPAIFPADKFDIKKVQLCLLDHFLHGIASLKGYKLLNKYKNINEAD